ncbi:MAG: glycosyltransferase family 2 protein, partial [Candidatus Omnitrophica bacterium]|nr:glycosyltransferase family 2 protein [Candidatus Omnitrophota bacterium]
MKLSPIVSVIIAAYNQGRYLEEALRSVFCQSLPSEEFEIIVVNDGSTDNTSNILKEYKDRVIVLEQPNQGLSKSCNLGLSKARGRYFVRLDSDDWMDPDLLCLEKKTLDENPKACCVYCDRYEISEGERRRIQVRKENLYDLIACGVMFQTEKVRAVGGYRSVYWEEYDLFLRLQEEGEFLYLPTPLYYYRRHQENMTNKRDRKKQGWVELIKEWGKEKILSLGNDSELE